jgi:hypothetical protein
MSLDGKKHGPALGDQPRHIEARLDAPSVTSTAKRDLCLTDPPTPVNEYSILVEALYEFAPNTHEIIYSEQSYTRSFEIKSAGVWERFIATLRPESAIRSDNATVLHAFIENKLR